VPPMLDDGAGGACACGALSTRGEGRRVGGREGLGSSGMCGCVDVMSLVSALHAEPDGRRLASERPSACVVSQAAWESTWDQHGALSALEKPPPRPCDKHVTKSARSLRMGHGPSPER